MPTHKSDADIISACGDSGAKWATEFVKKFPIIDEGAMIGWFSSAIETATAIRVAKYPTLTISEIRQAVARAWCADANRSKEMDGDLAEAASQEIAKLLKVDLNA